MKHRLRLIVILQCLALICMAFSFIVTGGSVWAKSISRWQGYSTNINCGLPTNNAMSVLPNGNLKVRIRHRDIGKCRTDPIPYKGKNWYKPYSERAELVIRKKLGIGRTHNIRFEAKFLSGFIEANRNESYFQIKGCAKSKVQVFGFLRRKHRYPFAFHLGNRGFIKRGSPVSLDLNKWLSFVITYRNARKSSLTVSVNGHTIVDDVQFRGVDDCGRNRLRIGIYRGGSKHRVLSTSSVEFRRLKIN